ncbi:hypothetical protein [[Phormidium] sp. ETS-05]|uniref:hypothetical protein n=1 Tax=[Phormidium] sp. ETS-05 TaxID=222819 RepID=UPI0018EF2643|nr:hypothetical protein [[Phormidium] sp. ETS-05]
MAPFDRQPSPKSSLAQVLPTSTTGQLCQQWRHWWDLARCLRVVARKLSARNIGIFGNTRN